MSAGASADFLSSEPVIGKCLQSDVKMPAVRPQDVSLDSGRARSLGFIPGPMAEELRKLDSIHG
ncbi:MAG: hypothetical protein JXA18_14155 [Chitinispirillaceae bacterium]|nr:hypothetical protein [Chitinispirillaceae bacterium]